MTGDVCFPGCNAWFDSGYSLCEYFGFWTNCTHFLRCGGLGILKLSFSIRFETTTTTHNNTQQHTTTHNNNNTIWGGSVLTGEEPPPHSGELKRALSQAGGPTQSQLSRPVSSGHHISMEHRLLRKQSNSDTNASNEKIFERNTRKMKRKKLFSLEKNSKKNEKHLKNQEMKK